MPEQGLTKNQILSELSRSPHGKLNEYVPVGQKATKQEPEFMAHLIAWNRIKGQVRDSHVALPIISLSAGNFAADLADNSLAHVALLGPRELLRAYRFALELKLPGQMRSLRRMTENYLRDREENWRNFDRVAVQHRVVSCDCVAESRETAGGGGRSREIKPKPPQGVRYWLAQQAQRGDLGDRIRSMGGRQEYDAAHNGKSYSAELRHERDNGGAS